jgi:hypothetical protein
MVIHDDWQSSVVVCVRDFLGESLESSAIAIINAGQWLDKNGLIAVGLMQGIETKRLWDLAHANVFLSVVWCGILLLE